MTNQFYGKYGPGANSLYAKPSPLQKLEAAIGLVESLIDDAERALEAAENRSGMRAHHWAAIDIKRAAVDRLRDVLSRLELETVEYE